MARKYEDSAADEAEDARGMKATGLSKKAYENSARDRKEDAAGANRIKVKGHTRGRRPPPPPPQPSLLAQAPGEGNENFPGGDGDEGF